MLVLSDIRKTVKKVNLVLNLVNPVEVEKQQRNMKCVEFSDSAGFLSIFQYLPPSPSIYPISPCAQEKHYTHSFSSSFTANIFFFPILVIMSFPIFQFGSQHLENVLIAVFDLSNKRILLTYYFDGTDAGGSIMERTLAPNQLWKAVCLIKVQILFAREVQIVKTPISFWTRSMRKLQHGRVLDILMHLRILDLMLQKFHTMILIRRRNILVNLLTQTSQNDARKLPVV